MGHHKGHHTSRPSDEAGAPEVDRREALIDQLRTLGETASTETALFHQVAAAKYGLGITDMKALSALLQEGAMTAGQLARRLSLTSGAVTNLIDRLERHDFVRRVADTKDRRRVIVRANQSKLASSDNAYLSIGEAFSGLLRTYSTEQLAFLVRYQQAAIELTKQEIAKLARSES
jgi:MarR family transcriptional regulator, organic hydroperoxide resistance regulator